ncbi:DUF4421 family protein [Dysgonomonas sp. 520]|uniref:DUF4421 family protein n=1 Tax=Dysgonomonas sp. 520 TaxID=2302931 RepID=UPI0013D86414|nr:DUF4421 family protein [Dysgonomonas sp. 520]NDW08485.1 DUF4421 domain-containing protein [Dysgonomonas sp. 520]
MKVVIYISISLIALLTNPLTAQTDSTYIKSYDQKLSVLFYTGKNFVFLLHNEKDKEVEYLPNNPMDIGAGFSLKNFFIGLSYGYGFDFMRDKKYGKTESFDFQLHNYGRKYALDLFIQQYKGFFSEEGSNNIQLFPELSVTQYGLNGQYIFNGKKFSYKAAFDQSEKQIKSAGSWLLGMGVFLSKIDTGNSILMGDKSVYNNFQFGVSGGYAYNWAIHRKWFIAMSVTTGINFGSDKINTFGKQRLEVYPTVFPRFAAGYNRANWSIGLSYLSNFIFPSFSEDSNIGLNSGNFRLSYIHRFDRIPFLDKKEK